MPSFTRTDVRRNADLMRRTVTEFLNGATLRLKSDVGDFALDADHRIRQMVILTVASYKTLSADTDISRTKQKVHYAVTTTRDFSASPSNRKEGRIYTRRTKNGLAKRNNPCMQPCLRHSTIERNVRPPTTTSCCTSCCIYRYLFTDPTGFHVLLKTSFIFATMTDGQGTNELNPGGALIRNQQ
jgi:hypothetical protein